MHARAVTRFTPEEYLAFESGSLEKHEFYDGQILAMSGGTGRHAFVSANASRALGNALKGRPCIVFSSDMRVLVQASGLYTYPDVSVACGPKLVGKEEATTLLNPVVLVEVLSKGTAEYDRTEKVEHYKKIPSLKAVLLVDVTARTVELVARTARSWRRKTYEADGSFDVPGIDVAVVVADLFEGIDLVPDKPS